MKLTDVLLMLCVVLIVAVMAAAVSMGVIGKGSHDDKVWDWCRKQGGEVVQSRSQGYVCVEAIRRTTT